MYFPWAVIPGPVRGRRAVVGHNKEEMRLGTGTYMTARESWKEEKSDGRGMKGGVRGPADMTYVVREREQVLNIYNQ